MTPPSPLEGVSAVLFDVFGTVVNWEESVHRQLTAKIGAEHLDIGDLDLLEFTRTWRAGYMRRTKAIAAGEPGPTNVDALHRELLDELLGESKWSALAVWDDAARTALCNFWHRLDGWPGSSEGIHALTELPGESILVGTLSNGSTRLLIDLARHAKLQWDFVFAADLLKAYKPSPKMYLGACELLALEPGQVAMVASHIYDLRAAAKYGLRTIYIPRNTEDQDVGLVGGPDSVRPKREGGEVDVVIHSLTELPALFARHSEATEAARL